jgi:antitoxin PrlF
MASSPSDPEIVRVSQKGQATIPQALREKFGIETPGEVFVYEEDGRIVVEPVPTLDQLHGIHADHEPGEVLARTRELSEDDRRREEREADELVERHGSGE